MAAGDVERWSWLRAGCYALLSANPRSNALLVDLAAPGPDDRVLDIGCGAGAAVRRAAARGAAAVGVDPSPAMVAQARRRSADHPGVRFEVGDAAALPLEDDSITVAMAIATYHHWPDGPAGLAEVRRVLAPGGRLLLGEKRLRRDGGHGLTDAGAAAVADLLRELGFRDVRVEPHRLRRFATMNVISARLDM